MTIQDFAACVAEARRSGRLSDMLAARGLDVADWAALKARFQIELESEATRQAFVVAYDAELQRQVPTFLRAGAAAAPAAPQRADAPPSTTDETAMLPAPEEIRRLILEADPRRAIPLGPRPAQKALSLEEPNEWGETLELPGPAEIRQIAEDQKHELSVDAYAVIRATVAVRPREVDLAFERYGVTPERRKDVERAMQRRLDNDRAARERFAERLQHFVGFLVSKQGAP